MNILTIPLDQIEVGERLRGVDEDYATLLADSIAEHGQMTPVEVRLMPSGSARPYALVAGAHRLRALTIAGATDALAAVFTGTEVQARLREIDENLVRHELTELDRATFLAERKNLYLSLHPETRHGGSKKGEWQNRATRFSKVTADRLKVSERWVRLAVTRHDRLHPDVRRRLVGTWLADHGAQLDALSKAVPSEQLRAVELMFGENMRLGSVGEALAAVRGVVAPPPLSADEVAFERFLARWGKSAAFRARVRAHVGKKSA